MIGFIRFTVCVLAVTFSETFNVRILHCIYCSQNCCEIKYVSICLFMLLIFKVLVNFITIFKHETETSRLQRFAYHKNHINV